MIDWDEVLEDVDWKKGVASVILIIIVVVAAVYLLHQKSKADTLKASLAGDLQTIKEFQDRWVSPDVKKMNDLEKKKKDLEAQINASGLALPAELDAAGLEAKIRDSATEGRVSILQVNPLPEVKDDEFPLYLIGLPLEVVISVPKAGAGRFLKDLQAIDAPHVIKSEPLRVGGNGKVTVIFYRFDLEAWNDVNDCVVDVTLPEVPSRDASGLFPFGGQVESLKHSVEQQKASLVDVEKKYKDYCELKSQVERAEKELQIIQGKLSQ